MSPMLTHDPDICARFLREARDTAALSDHPNIVTVHDVGHADKLYYISMQYVSGHSLKQLIDTSSQLPDVNTLMLQMADVLQHIHEKGFIHRDIKPANILFNSSGQAVLSDFGIARLTSHTSHLTREGAIVGTAKYMSPEQCRGDSAIDARSDLYSLGIVLFEVLTGRVPFEAAESMALMLKHLNDPIPLLPVHARQYQPIVDGLMAKQAQKRFATASALKQAINRLPLDESTSKNTELQSEYSADRLFKDHEIRTSTVLSVAVLLLVGLFGLIIFLTSQTKDDLATQDSSCPELTQAQIEQRNVLIELAVVHNEVGRITHPPGANAHDAYTLVLDIDPCHQGTLDALDAIRGR